VAKPEEALGRFLQGNRYWHTDSSFKKVGAKASLLRALELAIWRCGTTPACCTAAIRGRSASGA